MKKIWIPIIVVIIIIVAIAVFYKPTSKRTIKIGGVFGLTGFSATWGEQELKATQLAVEEINSQDGINGQRVELIVEDAASTNATTVTAVSKLLNVDDVKAVLGPTWLDTYGAAAPLSDSQNKIFFTASGASTVIQNPVHFKNAFSTWYRVDFETQRLVHFLEEKGFDTIVLLYGNEPYWSDFAEQVKKSAPSYGLKIVDEFKLPVNDPDFRTPLSKIKEINPDAVVFGFNGSRELLSLLQQRQVLCPETKFFSLESIEEFAFNPNFEEVMNNIWYAAPAESDITFREKFKEMFGIEPAFSASNAYDAAMILFKAMRYAGTETDAIREYLQENEFETVTFGKIRFDELNGPSGGKFVIKQIQNSKVETIEQAK